MLAISIGCCPLPLLYYFYKVAEGWQGPLEIIWSKVQLLAQAWKPRTACPGPFYCWFISYTNILVLLAIKVRAIITTEEEIIKINSGSYKKIPKTSLFVSPSF